MTELQTHKPVVFEPTGRWWAYLEATALVGIIALLNSWVFPDSPGFKGLPFSLLWVPILLISGRYGTGPGLFTALLCGGYYFYLVSLQNFFFGEFHFTLDDKVILLVFPFVAVFIGQMYDRLADQVARLQHKNDELQHQFDNLNLHHQALQKANLELEKRIVGRVDTIGSLYGIARELESLESTQLHRAVCDIVVRFLRAEQVCLYLRSDDNRITVAGSQGFPAEEQEGLVGLAEANPLLKKAWAQDRVLSFRDLPAGEFPKAERERVFLAAPIYLPSRKRTVGVIAIFRLPFLALNAANQRMLGIIADWSARAIEKSLDFSNLKARELDDELTGVYSFNTFNLRLSEEMNRAQRYHLPLSLLFLQIADYDLMPDDVKPDLLAIIGLVFNFTIREVDIACRTDLPSTFAVLLPFTDQIGGEILAGKLRTSIESYRFKPFHDNRDLSIRIALKTFVGQPRKGSPYKVADAELEEFGDFRRARFRDSADQGDARS